MHVASGDKKKTNKTEAAAEFEQDERRKIISWLLLYSFEK